MKSRTAEQLKATFAIALTFVAWIAVAHIDAREAALPIAHVERVSEWDAAFEAANADRPVQPRVLLAVN